METDIRSKSYDKCRGKFRTRFSGVSVPSKPKVLISNTYSNMPYITYIIRRNVSPLILPCLWVRFSTEFSAYIPSTPKDLDLLFTQQ